MAHIWSFRTWLTESWDLSREEPMANDSGGGGSMPDRPLEDVLSFCRGGGGTSPAALDYIADDMPDLAAGLHAAAAMPGDSKSGARRVRYADAVNQAVRHVADGFNDNPELHCDGAETFVVNPAIYAECLPNRRNLGQIGVGVELPGYRMVTASMYRDHPLVNKLVAAGAKVTVGDDDGGHAFQSLSGMSHDQRDTMLYQFNQFGHHRQLDRRRGDSTLHFRMTPQQARTVMPLTSRLLVAMTYLHIASKAAKSFVGPRHCDLCDDTRQYYGRECPGCRNWLDDDRDPPAEV